MAHHLESGAVDYMCVACRKALLSIWLVNLRTHGDIITALSIQFLLKLNPQERFSSYINKGLIGNKVVVMIS